MCILFAFVSSNPEESGYQLILANNRDEYFNRPTQEAHFWNDHSISGLDKEPGREGGTWFGVSTKGKVGVLLNILINRAPYPDKKGRGKLVTDFLTSKQTSSEYFQPFASARDDYNGYNLILLEKKSDGKSWTSNYFSNHDQESPFYIEEEIFGFSNATLGKSWKKVEYGKQKFAQIVDDYKMKKEEMKEKLIELLNDKTQTRPDPILEEQGKGYLNEGLFSQRSAVHVYSPQIQYGSRTNTVVIVDKDGHGEYVERTMVEPIDAENPQWTTKTITFEI